MTKPHEEQWRCRQTTTSVVVGGGEDVGPICTMSKPRAEMRLDMEAQNDLMRARAAFIAAAPDMARALLAFTSDNGHTPDCGNGTLGRHSGACSDECAAARAALRKAGVLP